MNKTLENATNGTVAGILATVPMTITMVAARRFFPSHRLRELPPKQITDKIIRKTPFAPFASRSARWNATALSHFGFGGTMGAVYTSLASHMPGGTWAKGLGFGFGVWAASYAGWLPLLNLQPDVNNQPRGRNIAMIAAHLVWGTTLAFVSSELNSQKANDQGTHVRAVPVKAKYRSKVRQRQP